MIEQLDQRQPKNSFKRCFAQVFTFDTVCRTSVIHYRQVHVRCPALSFFSLQIKGHHRMGKAGSAQRTLEFGEPEGQFQDETRTN